MRFPIVLMAAKPKIVPPAIVQTSAKTPSDSRYWMAIPLSAVMMTAILTRLVKFSAVPSLRRPRSCKRLMRCLAAKYKITDTTMMPALNRSAEILESNHAAISEARLWNIVTALLGLV